MNSKRVFLIAFLIFVATHTWYSLKKCHELPWPPVFIGAGLTFGMLSIFSVVSEELADTMAIGFVLAALVKQGFTGECSHDCSSPTASTATPNLPPGYTQVPGSTPVPT